MTQKQLAEMLGVSGSTVTKALQESKEVSEELREKIISEANRLGVKRKPRRTRKKLNILVIVPEFRSEFYGEVLGILNSIARERGFNMFAAETDFNRDAIRGFLPPRSVYYDGVIAEGPAYGNESAILDLKKCGVPIVTVGTMGSEDFDAISADIDGAMEEVIGRLIKSGRKRIGYAGENHSMVREISFRKAAEKFGMLREEYIFSSELRFAEAGAEGFEKLYSLPEPPDAIICAYDYIVIGLLNATWSAGVSVPEKLALIGFDNLRAAASYRLGITTIDQKSRALYEKVVDRLMARINGDDSPTVKILVKSEIVVRETAII